MKNNYKKYSKTVLNAINQPKSIPQIHQETKIPMSTLYRVISRLKRDKCIKLSGRIENGVRLKLYQYKTEKNVLGNAKVKLALDIIRKNPGVRYRQLQKITTQPNGTLSNIIYKLEINDLIVPIRYTKKTYFFPVHIPENEYIIWINLRHDYLNRILFYLLEHKKAKEEIQCLLNLSKSGTYHHLSKLVKDELIYKTQFPVAFRLRDVSQLQKVYDRTQQDLLNEEDFKELPALFQVQSANKYRRENSW